MPGNAAKAICNSGRRRALSGRLTRLSNVVAYACRPWSRKDRHDVHQHRRFKSSGAIVVGRLCHALALHSARPCPPKNDGRKGRKGGNPFPDAHISTKELSVAVARVSAISCRIASDRADPAIVKTGSGNCGKCGNWCLTQRVHSIPHLHAFRGAYGGNQRSSAIPPPSLSAWRVPRRSAPRSTPRLSGAGRRPRTAPTRWGWRGRGGCGRHGRRDRRWPPEASGNDF
jgi:hypothetical protein